MLVTIPVLKTWISLLTMSNWPRSTIACAWRASANAVREQVQDEDQAVQVFE